MPTIQRDKINPANELSEPWSLSRTAYLEDFLYATGNVVMLMPYHVGVKDSGIGIKGIHSRVDTQLGNATGQHSGGVQMGEGCRRGGISQIISWHIDGLWWAGRQWRPSSRQLSVQI